jgi:ribosomal protein S18 acetylase RimI-like enzyme
MRQMLAELDDKYTQNLSKELQELSEEDKIFFSPHEFDNESIKNLHKEKGNHYYLYLDASGAFAGYGMLRTFGKYEIPTLGCVIWRGYRQRGEGRKLVEELISKARELKYQKIRLKVHRKNKTAFQLYQKTGFRPMGKSEDELIWMEVMT